MEHNNPIRDDSSFQSGPSLSLTTELHQGKELARQLQMLLLSDQPPAFRHHDNTRELLVQRIIASFDRAVSIAQLNEPPAAPSPPLPAPSLAGVAKSDSPSSGGANSPRSEDSDPVNGDPESRRRQVQPRWTTKVQVTAETGFEGPPADGFNWRKYGQKDILGANFPRAYYRCALKQQTNCPATKQVQRTDEDPSLFEVTYRAVHTCSHPTNPTTYPSSSSSYPTQPLRPTETLISFNTPSNAPPFIVPQNTDFHHQHLPANPNPGFHFQASSSTPTTATSAITSAPINGAASSVSPASSPINITHDFPFDQFDFDSHEFFH